MLEIVILVLIWKLYYQLAQKYKQKLAWVYGFIGIVAYYGGAFFAGILLGLYADFQGFNPLQSFSDLQLTLIFIPVAALCCWGVYQLLKRKWHKEYLEIEQNKSKISDIGKLEDEIFLER